MEPSPLPTVYNNLDSLSTNGIVTVLAVSIWTLVTSPSHVKSSFTFLTSHNLNCLAPPLFQPVVTKVSLSIQANLALWNASLIWCLRIILFALGSKTSINLFLVVAPSKAPLGLQETQVGVSSAFNSQNVSPFNRFQIWISPVKPPLHITSEAIGLKLTNGTFFGVFDIFELL